MRLQWDSLSASGKEKIWFSLLPLAVLVSPSARMSHFVLFHWMMIQIFIAHTVSEAVVRGTTGRPVTLPCSYRVTRRSGISDMCWGRGPCPNSKCSNKILHTAGSKVTFRASQRYNLHGSVSFGDVSLTIGAVKAEDAGIYCCRVEIPGLFNDIKRNIRLEVARETTFAPQATSDLQPTPETAVWLTNSILLPETTAPESPTVTTGEISSPSTVASTENDIFPVTMVETSAPPDFPTTSQAADVMTEDVMFCSTLPGSTEVTSELPGTLPASVITEFPGTLPAAEETTSSVMMEEMSVMEVSANSDGSAGKHEDRRDKVKPPFPSSAILIACVIGGSSLLILMISLVWKRKQAKKFTVKSVGPPEETDKVFSGAEGENNIFSL
ncbi:PREDICTED: T-cell immunoglobulin and mucin domain-containing protein 4 isoform X2 [Pseudopodoces humilis]|uniref:T-cell immunoglobulin and mucin domain-containing protein 4 isoform X2 n=1 Tax=Pseudopodoces humilis TaxID=181119 RepID=UPI0006B75CFE|nr:PREDICTED: T-cell immunoglobulin and mucin domain-containing protein 4 isoform X2 [Pseudopodoces humilis]